MKKKINLLFLILTSVGMSSLAQSVEKREFEQSVKMHQVPGQILEYLSPFMDKAKKVKYFRESDGENLTWEVKLKFKGRQFSIEFFDNHTLKDIEELVRWKSLEPEAGVPLNDYFESNYRRFRIKRIQKQYHPGKDVEMTAFIEKVLSADNLPPSGFEIEAEVRGHDRGDFGFFEYQFDASFNLVSKRKIIPVSDGNLLF
ncbi:MAG: hypothetical protein V2I46_03105 [Bacteroides sp.]|jgi:hypothetical protein|nr:hypothetical protein [Bacteroides sp.]